MKDKTINIELANIGNENEHLVPEQGAAIGDKKWTNKVTEHVGKNKKAYCCGIFTPLALGALYLLYKHFSSEKGLQEMGSQLSQNNNTVSNTTEFDKYLNKEDQNLCLKNINELRDVILVAQTEKVQELYQGFLDNLSKNIENNPALKDKKEPIIDYIKHSTVDVMKYIVLEDLCEGWEVQDHGKLIAENKMGCYKEPSEKDACNRFQSLGEGKVEIPLNKDGSIDQSKFKKLLELGFEKHFSRFREDIISNLGDMGIKAYRQNINSLKHPLEKEYIKFCQGISEIGLESNNKDYLKLLTSFIPTEIGGKPQKLDSFTSRG